ncbi:discoidin domain-containing protein [Macellibacteroides fermentans]|uniref:discoidin domain-containing protein n=1 Tax=Macellibacteroides fermentans TaxID=879969 RepID=UPI00352CD827
MKNNYFFKLLLFILLTSFSSVLFSQTQVKFTGLTAERIYEWQPIDYMFDGNMETRWESFPGNDLSSFVIDMGAVKNINKLIIRWEAAGGASYDISFSSDNINFSSTQSVRDNSNLVHEINFSTVEARYIKFQGVKRMISCGECAYSAWEFEIYDTGGLRISDVSAKTVDSKRPFELMFDGKMDDGTISRWESFMGIDKLAFIVDLGAVKNISKINIHWEDASATNYKVSYSSDNITYTEPTTVSKDVWGGRTDELFPALNARYIKVENTKRRLDCGECGYSIWEFEVFDASNQKHTGLKAHLSDIEIRPLSNMFDGVYKDATESRWESLGGSDRVNFLVDLGEKKSIELVKIFWEYANSTRYKLSYSNDKKNFFGGVIINPPYVEGDRTDDNITAVDARYIRLEGMGRLFWQWWGAYSIWEFEVYGKEIASGIQTIQSSVLVKYDRSQNLIHFSENIEKATVYNSAGVQLKSVNNVNQINMQNLPKGIYILKFMDKEGIQNNLKITR